MTVNYYYFFLIHYATTSPSAKRLDRSIFLYLVLCPFSLRYTVPLLCMSRLRPPGGVCKPPPEGGWRTGRPEKAVAALSNKQCLRDRGRTKQDRFPTVSGKRRTP